MQYVLYTILCYPRMRKCQNLQWMPSKAYLQKQAKGSGEKGFPHLYFNVIQLCTFSVKRILGVCFCFCFSFKVLLSPGELVVVEAG